jgi:uncharacterized protein YneF (UPF0154 family)
LGGGEEGVEMSRVLRVLLVLAVAVGIGVAVSKMAEQKRQFLAMTEDEQRAFLADKIGDKVSEEKLSEIQDSVVSAVARRRH